MSTAINYWAVLVSAMIFYGFGTVWYSPLLFSKIWMAESGINEEKLAQMGKGHSLRVFITTFILSLLMAFITAHLAEFLHSDSLGSGVMLALMLWLGYVVSSMGTNYLYEDKSFRFLMINAGYFLIGLLEMSVILSLWK